MSSHYVPVFEEENQMKLIFFKVFLNQCKVVAFSLNEPITEIPMPILNIYLFGSKTHAFKIVLFTFSGQIWCPCLAIGF